VDWTGIAKGKQKEIEEEFQDQEHLATVTVVEDFDPDELIHGPPKQPRTITDPPTNSDHLKPPAPNPKVKGRDAVKKRRGKVRYETKDARRLERTKQRERRKKKVEFVKEKTSKGKKSGRAKTRR
jgi:ribosomal RNA-processing protein 17